TSGGDEASQFSLLGNLLHVLLTCVQQYDGRLLNPVGHHMLIVMWETGSGAYGGSLHNATAQQRQHAQIGAGLAEACRKAHACALAIKAKLSAVPLSTTTGDRRSPTFTFRMRKDGSAA